MSSEGMDPSPNILEQERASVATEPAPPEHSREWPGVSSETSGAVKFPGEDGGRSLARVAERDLDAALQLLAERAQYITGATGAAIALLDSDEMVCRASAGESAPEIGARLQMDSGLSGESIRTRQMLVCDDTQADERVNKEICESLGIASVVIMPMLDSGEVIGVFELFSDRAHAFEERDIIALERMSSMVKTAIEESKSTKAFSVVHEGDPGPAKAEAIRIDGENAIIDEAAGVTHASPLPTLEPEGGDAYAPFSVEPEVESELQDQSVGNKPIDVPSEAELAENTVFLTAPAESPNAQELNLVTKVAETSSEATTNKNQHEDDLGEMARDAAARTAAFKERLFAQETPAEPESAQRIAFHIPITKKVQAARQDEPARENEPALAKATALDGSELPEQEVPDRDVIEPKQGLNDNPKINKEFQDATSTPQAISVASESTTASAAASSAPPRSTTPASGLAAAFAPAREDLSRTEVTSVTTDRAASAKETIAANPADEVAAKPKIEIVRPASVEGRARIAVAQVRKCEACGFPVSEGRKLCLDCEKKPPAKTSPKSADHSATSPAPVQTGASPSAETQANETIVVPQLDTPSAQLVSANANATVNAQPGDRAKNEEAASSTSESTQTTAPSGNNAPDKTEGQKVGMEPPTPQFMVNAPDHYESWIVSHMYTAVAIAVAVVGIVVYLLSR